MLAIKQGGLKIPDDIAFAGFNNDPVSQVVEPNLTTIDYHGYEMGEIAVTHLINYLNGSSNSSCTDTVVLRSELIIRGSSLRSAPASI